MKSTKPLESVNKIFYCSNTKKEWKQFCIIYKRISYRFLYFFPSSEPRRVRCIILRLVICSEETLISRPVNKVVRVMPWMWVIDCLCGAMSVWCNVCLVLCVCVCGAMCVWCNVCVVLCVCGAMRVWFYVFVCGAMCVWYNACVVQCVCDVVVFIKKVMFLSKINLKWCYIILYHIILYHTVLYYVISYYIILYHATLYYIIFYKMINTMLHNAA